jgi:hypothetical protein
MMCCIRLEYWRHGEREEIRGPVKYYELAMAAILSQAEHGSDCCFAARTRVEKTALSTKKASPLLRPINHCG